MFLASQGSRGARGAKGPTGKPGEKVTPTLSDSDVSFLFDVTVIAVLHRILTLLSQGASGHDGPPGSPGERVMPPF